MTSAELADLVVGAFTGEPEDLVEVFANDGVLTDQPGQPPAVGHSAITAFFMAYGGRREIAKVDDVFVVGERGGLSYTVWFRADAHTYGQHGRVLLTFDDQGQIAIWDGAWEELEATLQPWDGD